MTAAQPEPPAWFKVLFGVAVIAAGVWWFRSSFLEDHVAENAAAQYEIVKRNGGALERCAQAQVVAIAWLQAKDEAQYARWKKIEADDCGKARAR
jgi:hypothetical protein